jgi:hypothetical protein
MYTVMLYAVLYISYVVFYTQSFKPMDISQTELAKDESAG